jgi:hypothetical protein
VPGSDPRERERIEDGWWRRGFEDARAGREKRGPDEWMARQASGVGLDTAGAYERGYADGTIARSESS